MALSRERRAEVALPPPSDDADGHDPPAPSRKRNTLEDSDDDDAAPSQPPAKKAARGTFLYGHILVPIFACEHDSVSKKYFGYTKLPQLSVSD